MSLPDLSRFELQCLRALWTHEEASVREIHATLPDAPTYSTVRKIFERLEEKGAIKRIRMDGRAWVYKPTVSRPAMIAKEVRRLIDGLFDGRPQSLIAHLADAHDLTLHDLKQIEANAEEPTSPARRRSGAERRSR